MNRETFIQELLKINITCEEKHMQKLNRYYQLLVEWNEKINLTTIIEEKEVYLKHFYDSLTVSKVVDMNKVNSLCDVGTGAGFPGLVIAIFFEDINVTLVDSLNKRIDFLNLVIDDLKLSNVNTIHKRAEEFSLDNKHKFEVVTARAVAPLSILLEICIPLTTIDGYFLAMKSNISQEIKTIDSACNKLGCKISSIEEFNLPIENSLRTIIKIKKYKETPSIYPRKYSVIKKRPL
jgi:16S rRNA (guanine527-N7)-methyltransferase